MIRLNIQFFAEEKTEKATPRKRNETRKKGQVSKSADLVTAISLLVMFLLFLFAIPWMGYQLIDLMTETFGKGLNEPLSEGGIHQLFTDLALTAGKIMAPVLALSFVIGIVANVAQVGFVFSSESISLKLNRLDPISGFKRIYSIRALVEFLKSLLKICAVGICTFLILWMNLDEIMIIGQKSLGDALVTVGKITFEMGVSASVVLLFLGLLDYLYQRFDFEKNIR
ncbi:MAG: EscU/YscU/HrcU family type III secretion system export apparatus switch protein, partial [Tuberibacillus sp.]